MVNRDKNNPPPNWGLDGVVYAGDDTYYRVRPVDNPDVSDVWVWHWCSGTHWDSAGVGNHTLVAAAPLHLEPSLLWPCCNKHGYIRNGKWEPA